MKNAERRADARVFFEGGRLALIRVQPSLVFFPPSRGFLSVQLEVGRARACVNASAKCRPASNARTHAGVCGGSLLVGRLGRTRAAQSTPSGLRATAQLRQQTIQNFGGGGVTALCVNGRNPPERPDVVIHLFPKKIFQNKANSVFTRGILVSKSPAAGGKLLRIKSSDGPPASSVHMWMHLRCL